MKNLIFNYERVDFISLCGIRGDFRGFGGFGASRKKGKKRLNPRLRSGQDFELGGGFGCLREVIWGIWARKNNQICRKSAQKCEKNAKTFENVRKRLKIFENVRKVV